jgi:hypothetical protein
MWSHFYGICELQVILEVIFLLAICFNSLQQIHTRFGLEMGQLGIREREVILCNTEVGNRQHIEK